jgi:site-specific DNA-methyltransferase (adenine-specific)
MSDLAPFSLKNRNPDVLTCIANLSNDEVFTPPEFVTKILDNLENSWSETHDGANIWSDSKVTFLDPFTKSGVFLREIVERLTIGLSNEFPNLKTRVNHIVKNQVFGIAITELTSLLSRRSVYCSKIANGKHSIGSDVFDDKSGNIWFEPAQHTWVGGRTINVVSSKKRELVPRSVDRKCGFCGVSERVMQRGEGLETHAYAFIHTLEIEKFTAQIFGGKMHFDVIIGNPPYQLNDGGGEGSSALPLYQKFVEQAKALKPQFLTMIIPARWYSGGKGLDEFRNNMLATSGLREIHDFPETEMVFPGVTIRGGVCYFLWEDNYQGDVRVVNYSSKADVLETKRPLLEEGLTTFVRYNEAISILRKVRSKHEPTMDTRVQSRTPFGIPSNFEDFVSEPSTKFPILLYRSRRGQSDNKEVYINRSSILSNPEFVDKIKVLVSKASPGGDEYPHSIFSQPIVAAANSASTETYLIVDFAKSEAEAENLISYMRSRFFRFLVSLIKNTQNISKGSFAFVPIQDFSRSWNDDDLYAKYGIEESEIAFIESMIRPMETVDE